MADKTAGQSFDFETMAVVLYAMLESGVTLGAKHFQMMSAVDGKRGQDSFNHQFRKVKARAKELQEQAGNGGVGTPVKKTKSTKGTTPAAGEKKTAGRGKKNKKIDDEEDEEGDESPSKKVKAEVEDDFLD